MSPPLPAIVIVHGAWHVPAHFQPVTTRLTAAGYDVNTVPLASVGPVPVSEPLAKDIGIIKAAIRDFTSVRKDVVVIMHSYGGLCGSDAVAEIFEEDKANAAAEKQGNIIQLFYVAAMILLPGDSLLTGIKTVLKLDITDGLIYTIEPYYNFYNAVTDMSVVRKAIEKVQPQALESFATPTKFAGWRDYGVPVAYLACRRDQALVYEVDTVVFKERLEKLEKEGGVVVWREMECDHSPWMSGEEEFWGVMGEVLGGVKL